MIYFSFQTVPSFKALGDYVGIFHGFYFWHPPFFESAAGTIDWGRNTWVARIQIKKKQQLQKPAWNLWLRMMGIG